MSNSSTWARKRWVLGCSLLGCALGAIACGLGEVSALAATSPVDAAAIDVPTPRPTAPITPAASKSHKQAVGATRGNPLWAIPLKSLSATRERPLFSPSRRPPSVFVAASPAPPPPKSPPAPPPLTLVGTAIGGSQSIAVFVDQATKTVIRLRTGEGHAGWTLRAIHRREAILEQDRREATLALAAPAGTEREAASVPTPAPIAAPPPPSQQPGRQRPAPPPGMWLDGDGQIVRPPTSQTLYTDGKPPPATWADGDGQLASAPPESGKPTGPATWLDGDGQWITPPMQNR